MNAQFSRAWLIAMFPSLDFALKNGKLHLEAVGDPDGTELLVAQQTGLLDEPEKLGKEVTNQLIKQVLRRYLKNSEVNRGLASQHICPSDFTLQNFAKEIVFQVKVLSDIQKFWDVVDTKSKEFPLQNPKTPIVIFAENSISLSSISLQFGKQVESLFR